MNFLLILIVLLTTANASATQCPENEEYNECGTACQESCTYKPSFCTYQCVSGCFCKKGFVRQTDDKSKCVPQTRCSCGVNEYFNDCGSACPDTCSARSQSCTKQCVPDCFCKDGFVRLNNRTESPCVPESVCKITLCEDPNAEFAECGSSCPRTCEDELNPLRKFRVCASTCRRGCFCKQGFVLGRNGKCVKPESCCRAINGLYKLCGSLCQQTCADENSFACLLPCASGCFCATDFVRENDNINIEDSHTMFSWSVQTRIRLALMMGYICITVFFTLTTYIVYVFYKHIAPSVIEKKQYGLLIFNLIFGNWLAINIYFNYLMAWLTSPGLARDYQELASQYPMCKKCSMNKPPRTHHCSWCDRCILKFDHHCPWLNNCVGFYNHRYFFQFCCFMATGCMYAGTFGYRQYQIALLGDQIFSYSDSIFSPFDILDAMGIPAFVTYYIFLAGFTIGFLLVGLILWHGRMIGRGVTSLERVLNHYYTHHYHEQGFIFVNPYDFGFIENWKRFLGVRTLGEFIRKVLLPSTHKPEGNGITWDGYNVNTNLHLHRSGPNQMARPIAFPPGVQPNFPGGYPANRYRAAVVPPWERQSRPTNASHGYQPKPLSTETTDDRKDQ
ncbi:unnamed protein product [Adineta ricciae]|uniref:Palmitoyltransferase n=1 Tax=Adineta ricciae TaxID=249248 RepID=A0A814XGR3_ADIRI|nr:unnamed protein product [Adineta ricciae]